LTATNDVFGEKDGGVGKHYVTVFVTAEIVGEEREAKVRGAYYSIVSRRIRVVGSHCYIILLWKIVELVVC
jgi:hypothetical protein